jgi:long-chain fatty acid transport protein
MQCKLRALLGVILSASMATPSFAVLGSNIANEVPSARSAGQGYVGVAGQNNDPTTAYSNPAGMTNLKGTQATIGLHFENIHPSYESDAGVETKAKTTNVAVPNFSVTQSFLDGKLGAGLSVQSPFGLESHWPGDSPMRYTATDSRLNMVEVMPAVAYQVLPMLSIGAGIKYVNAFNTQLDRHISVDTVNAALGVPTAGSPDAVSSLRGQAADWGYHAGLVLQPHEKHAIGITYHSKIDLRVNGNVTLRNLSGASAALFGGTDYTTSAYTDLVLPSNIQFGYAFKPNGKWMFEADTTWMHWSELKDVNVRFNETNPFRQAILQTGNPSVLDLRDKWSFATGANYKATDRWQVRSGFWYVPWALSEGNFNPAFNDLTRYGLSFGTGYGITDSLVIDFAYNAVFFHSRVIHNTVGTYNSGIPPGGIPALGVPDPNANGTYKDFANLFALNLTYKFGQK